MNAPEIEMVEAADSVVEMTAIPPRLQEAFAAKGLDLKFVSQDPRSMIIFKTRQWRAVTTSDIQELEKETGENLISEIVELCEDPARNYGLIRKVDAILVCRRFGVGKKFDDMDRDRAIRMMGQTNTLTPEAEAELDRNLGGARPFVRVREKTGGNSPASSHVVGGRDLVRNDADLRKKLAEELENLPT